MLKFYWGHCVCQNMYYLGFVLQLILRKFSEILLLNHIWEWKIIWIELSNFYSQTSSWRSLHYHFCNIVVGCFCLLVWTFDEFSNKMKKFEQLMTPVKGLHYVLILLTKMQISFYNRFQNATYFAYSDTCFVSWYFIVKMKLLQHISLYGIDSL